MILPTKIYNIDSNPSNGVALNANEIQYRSHRNSTFIGRDRQPHIADPVLSLRSLKDGDDSGTDLTDALTDAFSDEEDDDPLFLWLRNLSFEEYYTKFQKCNIRELSHLPLVTNDMLVSMKLNESSRQQILAGISDYLMFRKDSGKEQTNKFSSNPVSPRNRAAPQRKKKIRRVNKDSPTTKARKRKARMNTPSQLNGDIARPKRRETKKEPPEP